MAKLLYADGRIKTVKPKDGKKFSLKELQQYVEGYIEIVHTPDGELLICNEEGRLQGLRPNLNATNAVQQLIVGNAVLCNPDQID